MFRVTCFRSIPLVTRLSLPSVVVCSLALFNLGCGPGPQAEFKLRKTTEDLINSAKKSVKDTLTADFGTPEKLVAWDRFPISYGGVKGTVTGVSENKTLAVTLDGNATGIDKGDVVQWTSGSLASGKSSVQTVASFDHDKSQLVLAGGSGAPTVGDRFIAGFGEEMQMGRRVYMKNCMHCHGVSGDGDGPTGKFLNPRPRDYRNGVFKFTSTRSGEKPTHDDLDRIVKYGIPGTYMPSFLLLGDRETHAVVEYIRWLAIRGEFEKRLVGDLSSDYSMTSIADSVAKAKAAYAEKKKAGEKPESPISESKAANNAKSEFAKFEKEELPGAIDESADFLAESWTRAEQPETMVVPSVKRVDDTPESRERGRLLFMSDKTKCYTCHGMTGRGDGGATEDFWPKPGTTEKYTERGLHDEWGFVLKPRNLLQGQYRGGRRPVDVFRRMYAGIKGTPMPAFGGTALKDAEIWDLVNYVMSLPYSSKQAPVSPEAVKHAMKHEEKPAH